MYVCDWPRPPRGGGPSRWFRLDDLIDHHDDQRALRSERSERDLSERNQTIFESIRVHSSRSDPLERKKEGGKRQVSFESFVIEMPLEKPGSTRSAFSFSFPPVKPSATSAAGQSKSPTERVGGEGRKSPADASRIVGEKQGKESPGHPRKRADKNTNTDLRSLPLQVRVGPVCLAYVGSPGTNSIVQSQFVTGFPRAPDAVGDPEAPQSILHG